MCMYICMHIFIYKYVCIYTLVSVFRGLLSSPTCASQDWRDCSHSTDLACRYISAYIYIYIYIYIYMYIYIYICIYSYIYLEDY